MWKRNNRKYITVPIAQALRMWIYTSLFEYMLFLLLVAHKNKLVYIYNRSVVIAK